MKKLLALLVVVAVLFTACAAQTEHAATESSAAVGSAGGYDSSAENHFPAETQDASSSEEGITETAEDAGIGDLTNASIPDTNRKLIYTATFDIASREYEQDYEKILDALEIHDGYVESEDTSGTAPQGVGDSGRSTSFVLRIPVDQYDAFLEELSGIGTLRYKNLQTEDVSSEYYDVETRIELLNDRYERLKGHLDQATDMNDIIALEAEISNVLYELDALQGQRQHMDELIQYTRVIVNLNEEVNAGTITAQDGTFGQRAGDAFANTMTALGEFFTEFGIGFVGALPVLVILAAIAGIVLGIVFGVRKHRKGRMKEEK